MPRPFSKNTLEIFANVTALGAENKRFTLRDLVDELGLSRQLVHNQLTKLLQLGFVEKEGLFYNVPDVAAFNAWAWTVTQKQEQDKTRRVHEVEGVFESRNTTAIKDASDAVLYAQSIKEEHYQELKLAWLAQIDRAIYELKRERKFVTSRTKPAKQLDEATTKKIIQQMKRGLLR